MLSWITKFPVPKNMPKEGDVRIKRRFLLFPKSIAGETRWLGVAYWEEQCRECTVMDFSAVSPECYQDLFWEPTKWIPKHLNKEKKK